MRFLLLVVLCFLISTISTGAHGVALQTSAEVEKHWGRKRLVAELPPAAHLKFQGFWWNNQSSVHCVSIVSPGSSHFQIACDQPKKVRWRATATVFGAQIIIEDVPVKE